MEKQSNLNIVKTNLKLRMMAGLKGFSSVEIPEIPKEWTRFLNTQDEWCGIELPNSENSTGCFYKAKAGSVFDPHDHEGEIEHIIIMNEKGSMTVYVQDYGTYTIKYPNAIAIPKKIAHAVEFLEDTVIMIVWHPKFKKGWKAKFKEEENKKQ